MAKGEILIVDDDEGMRVTLKKILSNLGYSVTTSEGFNEANYYLQEKNFDTVVADIILPDASGIELLRVIREKSPDIPTIMITGEPNIKTAMEAVQLGAYDYLVKPVTKDNLPSIIAKAVEKKKLLQDRNLLKKENLANQQNVYQKLQTPFTLIQDSLLYLKHHTKSNHPDIKKHFSIIEEEIETIRKIINDFFSLVPIDTKRSF